MENSMEKLVLVDGNSLINRAFYALPILTNSRGEYCNAIYGFCNLLTKIIDIEKPKYMAICFDAGKKTFRNDIFKEYKGTRKSMPQELALQLDNLKTVLKAMNIFIVEQSGIEADDLIGSLSKKFDISTVIFSGDRDLLQLIDDTTEVHLTKKGVTETMQLTNKNLLSQMGVEPYQIVELKALMGDSSDNIPGVMGIGEKTAKTLLEQYKNVENLYNHIDEQKGKLKEKLVNGKESCFMSKTLATIKTDVKIDVELENLTYDFPFNKNVFELFKRFEFRTLLKRKDLFLEQELIPTVTKSKINIVETNSQIENLINQAHQTNMMAVYIDQDIHISFSKYEENIIKFQETDNLLGLDLNTILFKLKPVFEDEKIKKISCYSKNLMHILDKNDIKLNGLCFDFIIAEYLLSGAKRGTEDVYTLVEDYGFDKQCICSCFICQKTILEEKLKQDEMFDLFQNVEMPLVEVLFNMEKQGFKFDKNLLKQNAEIFKTKTEVLTKELFDLAGQEFNINSPKQVAEILFDKLLLPRPKKSGTGVMVLEKLKGSHLIVDKLLEYRKVSKLYSAYLQDFEKLVDENNFIHTFFNQTLTQTGRLSSQEPNLQNIPIKTDEGKLLRKMFISRFENGEIISGDYSQIELRLLAHYSKEPKLVLAYQTGKDIHASTASDIFNANINEISYEQRSKAKAVNFGIIYGISEYGLAQSLNISPKEAKEHIDKYFEIYPKVKEYMQQNILDAKDKGYAITMLKRRRKIDEINSSNYQTRMFGERVAMNMPLQGTASDIIKLAMVKVYQELKKHNLKSELILQIHDELIIDCVQSEKEQVIQILKECMENVVKLEVPLVVDISCGKTWFEAK